MKHLYIYETPDSKEKGYIKIGDAEDIEKRIKEQLNTAAAFDASHLNYALLYSTPALKDDGSPFRDHQIHSILESKGYKKLSISHDNVMLKSSTEWFNIDLEKAINLIEQFKKGKNPEEIDIERFQDFPMRPEQKAAVEQTKKFFKTTESATKDMLWNAKMRFGKTFTAYQLMKEMEFSKTLILTYKPAVEDAWRTDLQNHVDFKDYLFLKRDSLTHLEEYFAKSKKIVAFASYQDILGTKDELNEIKDRHITLFDTQWDIVIIDEFHYGTGTQKAQGLTGELDDLSKKDLKSYEKEMIPDEDEEFKEIENSKEIEQIVDKTIRSSYRLYLSGTPFKAIADSRFDTEAIFNWTYTDEQRAKEQWDLTYTDKKEDNPYKKLPQIQMFVYKVSSDLIDTGKKEDKDEFSLNHFFKAKNKKFINEEAVLKWLNLISGVIRPHKEIEDELIDEVRFQSSQYPYDHEGSLVDELDHTLWYLNRVDSAYALKELLEKHSIFKKYHVILAAGKGKSGVEAVEPVLKAIDENKKTITITVGKLTTGVSVPKWKAVMFLRDTDSPENYFQTAFRAQTPYEDKQTNYLKKVCYIFDFSPNRSLKLLTSYSEKLSSDSHLSTSEEKIGEFIKYLPVLKVAGNTMVSMDAREVLTFDLSGIDAKGLGERFIERKNIVVTRETIEAINESEQNALKCQEIFEKIKAYKRFIGATNDEMKQSDAEVANLDVNNNKIKKLQTKDPKTPKEEKDKKKELDSAEKELKSERDKVRELLKTLLSRIPIFMYLTDATEENLEQVLIETKKDLFRKATGVTIDDFRYLKDIGLIKVDSLDGYILKFVQLENQNFETNNELKQTKLM
jgi:superfamily II DNA or RNA helicase